MDFDIPKDLQDYLKELDDFIEREIKPLEQENDNIRFFDHRREDARTNWDEGGVPSEDWEALLAEVRRRADAAGHYRYPFPKEYDGKDGTNLGMAIIREHLAAKGLGLHCDLQNEHSIVGNNVGLLLMLEHGTEEQKAEWVPKMLAGQGGFAFGITEPEHGSDATHMETNAYRDGDEWVLNGEKTWISNGGIADFYVVFARDDHGPDTPRRGARGISAYIVEAGTPGLDASQRIDVIAPHPLAQLAFRDCRVPATQRVGDPGQGFKVAMRTLDVFRTSVAAAALGMARRALDAALLRATTRRMFEQLLADFQLTQATLAQMATTIDSAALLTYRAAWLRDRGENVTREAAMAKMSATEGAQRVIDAAVQMWGGLGVVSGEPVEQLYREIRALRIYEGATEVQQLIIARELLKDPRG